MNSSTALHTAIIMDGNGRWARSRGLPRSFGHRQGANAVKRVVEAAPGLGIRILTLYAFSSDNWQRPSHEVENLMSLFERFLDREASNCTLNDVRLSVIGRRDRLRPALVRAIEDAERKTRRCSLIHLRLAVDYSAREAIATAASKMTVPTSNHESFSRRINQVIHSSPSSPDVDLLIRTGGEKRLSDFMLWESAYAELVFCDRLWPDFGAEDLAAAVGDFRSRQRRFGRLAVSTEHDSDHVALAPASLS